jgi:hypothetical protein
MKSGRDMGLESQIGTIWMILSRQMNRRWMSDFYLRYNQRKFSPHLWRNRSRSQRLALLCLPVEVFANHGNSVARRCMQFSPLKAGAETDDSQSHEA